MGVEFYGGALPPLDFRAPSILHVPLYLRAPSRHRVLPPVPMLCYVDVFSCSQNQVLTHLTNVVETRRVLDYDSQILVIA